MILLLEGPDGAGKSTLCGELVRQHAEEGRGGTATWHRGPFRAEHTAWEEYVVDLLRLEPNPDWLVVMDRWHLGELVYGPLLRGESKLSRDQRAWIDGLMRDLGAVYVHAHAPSPVLMSRLGDRGDDLISVNLLPRINDAYAGVFMDVRRMTPGPRTMAVDTDHVRASAIAPALLAAARMESAVAAGRRRHPSAEKQPPYHEREPWPT